MEDKELLNKELDNKVKNFELQIRNKETENFKKTSEFEKLNALIE
jgi:hypothetical protein